MHKELSEISDIHKMFHFYSVVISITPLSGAANGMDEKATENGALYML